MLAVAVVLAAAGCNGGGEGDNDELATAFDHGVKARQAMAKAGYGGREITVARCGQHFDATETEHGRGQLPDPGPGMVHPWLPDPTPAGDHRHHQALARVHSGALAADAIPVQITRRAGFSKTNFFVDADFSEALRARGQVQRGEHHGEINSGGRSSFCGAAASSRRSSWSLMVSRLQSTAPSTPMRSSSARKASAGPALGMGKTPEGSSDPSGPAAPTPGW